MGWLRYSCPIDVPAAQLALPSKEIGPIDICIAVYESLRESERQLLLDEGIKNQIAALKARYNSKISDEKALDFLLWSAGR